MISTLFSISLPGYTWQWGLEYTGYTLQTLRYKDMILLFENIIRGGIRCMMGDRCIKSDEIKKILGFDANNSFGWAMSESVPCDKIQLDRNVEKEDILNTRDDSDIGYFKEVHLEYPYEIKEENKSFRYAPENKKIKYNEFTSYMKKKQTTSL